MTPEEEDVAPEMFRLQDVIAGVLAKLGQKISRQFFQCHER